MPAVSVEGMLQGPCCTQRRLVWGDVVALFLIPLLLHVPQLLGGIVPKWWAAGDRNGLGVRCRGLKSCEKLGGDPTKTHS